MREGHWLRYSQGTMYSVRSTLRQSEKQQNESCIVNVASIAGLIGVSGQASYVAFKHGVVGLIKVGAN